MPLVDIRGQSHIRPEFINRMEYELLANEDEKGDFSDWKPAKSKAFNELSYHVMKLTAELAKDLKADNGLPSKRKVQEEHKEKISEHCADIANIAMKISEIYGDS